MWVYYIYTQATSQSDIEFKNWAINCSSAIKKSFKQVKVAPLTKQY